MLPAWTSIVSATKRPALKFPPVVNAHAQKMLQLLFCFTAIATELKIKLLILAAILHLTRQEHVYYILNSFDLPPAS